MFDDVILNKLRDARAEYYGGFNESRGAGIFAGWYDDIPDARGYFKYVQSARGGGFQRFTGTVPTTEIEVKDMTITADKFVDAVEVDITTFDRAEAIIGSSFGNDLRNMGNDAALLPDRVFTKAVAANGNSILGTGFFGNAISIPGGKGYKLKNQTPITAETEDGLRAAVKAARQLFPLMLRPDGEAYHDANIVEAGFEIMYPVKYHDMLESIFGWNANAAAGVNNLMNRFKGRPNALMDAQGINELWIKPINLRFKPLLWVRTPSGMRLQDNVSRGGGQVEAEVQRTQRYRFTGVVEGEGGFANVYGMVRAKLGL